MVSWTRGYSPCRHPPCHSHARGHALLLLALATMHGWHHCSSCSRPCAAGAAAAHALAPKVVLLSRGLSNSGAPATGEALVVILRCTRGWCPCRAHACCWVRPWVALPVCAPEQQLSRAPAREGRHRGGIGMAAEEARIDSESGGQGEESGRASDEGSPPCRSQEGTRVPPCRPHYRELFTQNHHTWG